MKQAILILFIDPVRACFRIADSKSSGPRSPSSPPNCLRIQRKQILCAGGEVCQRIAWALSSVQL